MSRHTASKEHRSMSKRHLRAWLLAGGLLAGTWLGGVHATRVDTGTGVASPPRIVPSLLLGRDTAAEAAAAKADPRYGTVQDGAIELGAPAPLQQFRRAAEDAARVLDLPVAQADRAARLTQAAERLRAAHLLVLADFDRIEAQLRTQPLPGGNAATRIATARTRWQALAAPVLDAYGLAARASADATALDRARDALDDVGMATADAAVFGNDVPPVHRPRLLPREPRLSPSIVPSYASDTLVDAAPEDLAAGSDATLSPAVRDKAASLGNNPVALFDFVRSQVRTEWRVGSAQSVEDTLRRGAGNDVEQASLLVALLRASMMPARYVTGVVEVPVAELSASIGVPVSRVGTALAAAGVPHEPVLAGGQLSAFRIEHVWVSTRVPFANYRGSVADDGEPTWIALMPALKPSVFTPGTPVLQALSFDTAAWIDTSLSTVSSGLPWPTLRAHLASRLAAQTPATTLDALRGTHALDAAPLGVLPASTPHRVVAVNGELPDLLDEQRQWLTVRVRSADADTASVVLDQRIALASMASRRITLAYLPATVEDQQLAHRRGGLGGFPAYLVQLRPTLLVDGRPVAAGSGSIEAGRTNRLELVLQSPAGELALQQTVLSGTLAALAVDPTGGIAAADANADAVADSDTIAGRLLGRFAERYLRDWARADDESASAFGTRLLRPLPSVVLALPQYRAEGAFGLVDRFIFDGVALDAAAHPVEPISLRAVDADEADWMRVSALHGSALEAQLFEQQWAVDALSADRALQLAIERNVPVLQLAPGDGVGALSAHAQQVRDHVALWLDRGYHVAIPQTPLTEQAWTGAGWRVYSPDGGDSGYFVSGVYAGGVTVIPPGLWYFQDLAGALADPYAVQSNDDPLAGFLVQLDADAQYQTVRAGEWAELPLRAFVSDRNGLPVRGATVTFGVREGTAQVEGEGGTGATTTATTDHRGVASVRFRAPENNAGLDGGFLLLDGDSEYSRAYTTAIDLVVTTHEGPLTPGEPYFSHMVSGDAVRLTIEPRIGTGTQRTPGLGFEGYTVHAWDAFDNEVSNVDISLSVSDQYVGPGCAGNFALPGSGVYVPETGVCENVTIYAGCAPTSASGTTSYLGLYVNLVPSSIAQTRITLTATSSAGSATQILNTTGFIDVEGGVCILDPWVSVLQWTVGEAHEVALPGELNPFPRRFDYFASANGPGAVGPIWAPIMPSSTSLQISGGSGANQRAIGPGSIEFDFVGGGAAAPITGVFQAEVVFPEPDDIIPIDMALLPAWTVELPAPTLAPDFVTLDAFQRSAHDILIRAPVQPPGYNSEGITIEIVDDRGNAVGGCYHDQGNSNSSCVIPRGTRFEPDSNYEARYVINSGFTRSLTSGTTEVPFERGIIAGYGAIGTQDAPPDLDVFVARKFPKLVEIQTEVDTQTGYVCTAGARFIYAVGQDANVDITFYSLDEDGERGFEVWNPVNSEQRAEGVYTFDISPDEMSFGAYEYEIVATTADDEETHIGRFIHREKRRGSLPLSHSFVKGVDVYDGHAVISAQDAAIGGRGPGLKFTRTYASHSGDDKTLLGRGWESDLESRVLRDTCGTYTVTGGAGQGQRYLASGTGPGGETLYRSANGFHGTLVPLGDGSYDFFAKDGTRYHYAEPGREGTGLSFIEDTNANRVTYEYAFRAGEQVIERIVDSAGRAINLRYEVLSLVRDYGNDIEVTETRLFLTALEGPAGLNVEYTYDSDGNLLQVRRSGAGGGQKIETYAYEDRKGMLLQDPDGEFRYYHFGYRLVQARDAVNGATRDYAWMLGWMGVLRPDNSVMAIPEQRVQRVTEPDNGSTEFVYEGLRGVTITRTLVTDARSALTTYTMNDYGGAETVAAPNGTTTTVWNLEHLQPSSVTDVLGTTTSYTYDDHGNKVTESVQHAHGTLQRAWSYASPGSFGRPIKDRLRTATDARNIVTTFAYDGRGNLTGSERGGVSEQYGVDGNGDRSSHTNGRGDIVRYTYDAWGNVTGEADALGTRRTMTYDARGRLLTEADGKGNTTRHEYDALDRRIRTTLAAVGGTSAQRSTQYVDAQRKRIETDENQNSTEIDLDGMGREVAVKNALNKTRSMTYDRNGNLLTSTDFRGNTTTNVYDSANRLERSTQPEGRVSVFTHDALGNVLTQTVSRGGSAEIRRSEFRYEHPLNLRTHERHQIDAGQWSETVTAYDGNGNPTSVTDANGHATTRTYDNRDRLERVDAPETRSLVYVHDNADNVTRETLNTSPAQVRQWSHDARGRERTRVDGAGATWTSEYDLADNLVRFIDPNGKAWNYDYDARNRRTGERGPETGQVNTYAHDGVGNVTREVTADGRELDHTYDDLHRREQSVDQLGTVQQLGYDDDGNVTRSTDAEGRVTTSTWNGLNQETARVLPTVRGTARALDWDYSVHGEVLREVDANDNATTHTYDGLGRRTATQLPGGGERRWSFDAVGNVLTATDADNRVSTFEYDDLNRRTRATDPSPPGTTQSWQHDTAGNVVLHTDRRGIPTSFRFDGENRVLESVRDGLRLALNVYDGAGNLVRSTDANAEQTVSVYDGDNRRTRETRPLQHVQQWTYTPWGGVETATDADGVTTSSTYDVRRRVATQTDGAGETTAFGYDGVGNRTRVTRPDDLEWTYVFDAADRIEQITSPEASITQYRYDAHGNRTSQQDAGNQTTTFGYDEKHRIDAVAHPGGANETFEYDNEGHLTERVDGNGQRIASTYDGMGRLQTRSYDGASGTDIASETWTYDANGNIERIEQDEAGGTRHATTRTWDRQERLASETDRYGQRTDYGYDAVGNQVRRSDPSGETLYQRDRLYRIAQLSPAAGGSIVLGYSTAGRLNAVQQPNGAQETVSRDDAGRVERIEHRQGSVLVASFDYAYDARGNRDVETQVDPSGTRTISYGYDDDDRLVGLDIAGSDGNETHAFTLDAVGNRRTETLTRNAAVVSDKTYDYGPRQRLEQLTDSVPGVVTTYEYDANGSLVAETRAGQTTTYRQNAQDRLATLTLPGAPPVDYAYDADGRRVLKQSSTEAVRYGWDGTRLRRETNVTNNVLAAYDWAASRVLRSQRGSDISYAQHDALRSPVRWSRTDGNEQGRTRYDAWGGTAASTGTVPPVGYTGHYKDAESGDYYAQQRYYRPGLGRFTRIDPWEGDPLDPVTLNKYLYGNGNPLIWMDPDGEKSVTTMIDEGAEGCGVVSCAGWALLQATYQVATLGFAAVHDPVEDAYDRGEVTRGEYWTKGVGGGLAVAGVNAATGRVGGTLVMGAKTAVGRVATAGAVGAASGAIDDAATQGVHLSAGIQDEYDLARTGRAALVGAAVGTVAGGAGEAYARRQAKSAGEQSKPVITDEGSAGDVVVRQEPNSVAAEVAALRRIGENNANRAAATSASNFRVTVEGRVDLPDGSSYGRGYGAHQTVDRVAGEYAGALQQANRILQTNRTPQTRWEAIVQSRRARGAEVSPMIYGNALQQVADTLMRNNRYVTDAGTLMNRQSLVTHLRPLRPDLQVPVTPTRQGVLDITTPRAAPKIDKYDDPANIALINILYEQR